MAVSGAQVSVATTATLLSATETDSLSGETVLLNNTGAAAVFLGPAGVTTATGYSLAAGAVLRVELAAGEALYGVVAAATNTVSVLRLGV